MEPTVEPTYEMLAELVRNYPFIYDTTDFLYKDLTKKNAAWEDIATRINVSSTFAKNKWKSLREAYVRAKRMGNRTTLQRLDYLSFLDEYSRPRKTWSNIPTQHLKPATEAGSFDAVSISPSSPSGVRESVTMSPSPLSARSESTNTGSPTITESSNVSFDDSDSSRHSKAPKTHPLDKLIEYLQQRKQPDDVDLMFASFAESTKKLKPANQVKIKLAIVQLISDLQIEEAKKY